MKNGEWARAVQVVAGILAVAVITVTSLVSQPTGETELWVTVGSSFTLIAALLGVHYSIAVVQKKNGSD